MHNFYSLKILNLKSRGSNKKSDKPLFTPNIGCHPNINPSKKPFEYHKPMGLFSRLYH